MAMKILRILLGLTLVLVLACGAAATATPPLTSAPQPTTVQPTARAAVAPATPAPTSAPAAKVNPGKLTIMLGISVTRGSTAFSGRGQRRAPTMAGFCTGFSSSPTREQRWSQVSPASGVSQRMA